LIAALSYFFGLFIKDQTINTTGANNESLLHKKG